MTRLASERQCHLAVWGSQRRGSWSRETVSSHPKQEKYRQMAPKSKGVESSKLQVKPRSEWELGFSVLAFFSHSV